MVSYCTTCMDRLRHLMKTLPRNVEAVAGSDCEFVVLDYGGTKGLETWFADAMAEHLASGMVRLVRTRQPRHWFAPHAKNVAHRCARGDILANLDADVFIPEGFTGYVQAKMNGGRRIMQPNGSDIHGHAGTGGLVILMREHFYSVNGYDESLAPGWTCEDLHLQFRARMKNGLELVDGESYCTVIHHSNEMRFSMTSSRRSTYDQGFMDLQMRHQESRWMANEGVEWGSAPDLEELAPQGWAPLGTRCQRQEPHGP